MDKSKIVKNKKLLIVAISLIAVFVVGISTYSIVISLLSYPFDGAGTKSNPYLITSRKDLMSFESINKKTLSDQKGKYFKLTVDIDLEGYEWTPIGYNTYKFYGHFDGDGHTISNFKIKDVGDTVGFFEQIEKGNEDAGIFNLSIKNASLTTVRNVNNIGILVGNAVAVIENCSVEGALTVSGTPANVGMVAGYAVGDVVGCKSDGHISVSAPERVSLTQDWYKWPNLGGLIGNTEGNIFDSTNHAKIDMSRVESTDGIDRFLHVGGICGSVRGSMYKDLINYGDINAVGALGGIIGTISSEETVVQSCSNFGNLYSTSDILLDIGGIVARTYTYGRPEIRNSLNSGRITLDSIIKIVNGETHGILNCFVGGVLGTGNAHVYNSVSIGNMDIRGEATHYVGGIVGGANGIIRNSYHNGNISVVSQKGSVIAGGVIAIAQDNDDVSISSCYSVGGIHIKVDDAADNFLVGGIMGFNTRDDNIIQNNYYDIEVTNAFQVPSGFISALKWYGEEVPDEAENIDSPSIFGNIGINTSVLQATSLTGFKPYSVGSSDPDAVWIFIAGEYPKLYWQNII